VIVDTIVPRGTIGDGRYIAREAIARTATPKNVPRGTFCAEPREAIAQSAVWSASPYAMLEGMSAPD
jgi:hypothetical protein